MTPLTPAEIRSIAKAVGGSSALARRLGKNSRTVRGWIEEPPRSAPESTDAMIDAWAVAVIERLVADLTRQAVAAGTLAGRTVTLRAELPDGLRPETEARLRARLAQLAGAVLPNVNLRAA
jgi:hypothetical protein